MTQTELDVLAGIADQLRQLVREVNHLTRGVHAVAEATIAVNDDAGHKIATALERIALVLEGESPQPPGHLAVAA